MKLVLLLLDEGADPGATDKDDKSAIDYLPAVGSEQIRAALASPPLRPSRPLNNVFKERQSLLDQQEVGEGEQVSKAILSGDGLDITPALYDDQPSSPSAAGSAAAAVEEQKNPANGQPCEEVDSAMEGNQSSDSAAASRPATLVFWPPVRQQQRPALPNPPLRLSSAETVLICISSSEVDIFPLLLCSGLVEVMDQYGLQGIIPIMKGWTEKSKFLLSIPLPSLTQFR